ncbi:MAG: undecaprenyl/decaprenyl-phosphate alpha-N-acetylglucosaminyl 1-phosphate transferase [Bacteroidia bacterium]|nr:undecaprenyl/decaprenyl-phosphate alpha-N-acetylglucosaminyl 1-phosphate transferase [Bacteroidia bacterium]
MTPIANTNLTIVSLLFLSFIFSLLINYILLKFASTLGIRSKNQNEIRWNPKYKPSLGGISFYIGFLFSFIFLVLINTDFQSQKLQMLGVLLSCSLAFLMGLSDDAFNTQPLLKLITQIVCALVLIYSGIYIKLFENALINYALTVFWIVGIMNSVNLLDNMDGIVGIVGVNIALFFILISITLQIANGYIAIFNICLMGTLLGFLVFNFHPSKMYMGDSGSQFLGLFLSAIGIDMCWNMDIFNNSFSFTIENLCVVLLVFLLPITDTTTVFTNRILKGNSPFVGGKDHTTHHLFFRGFSEKRIAVLYFLISLIGVILAYNLIFNHTPTLLYISIFYILAVFLTLYLNTVIKKR